MAATELPAQAGGCLLADDMGLGKTLQTLLFLAWLIEEEEKWQDAPPWNPIPIVAPLILLDDDGPRLKDLVSGLLMEMRHCTPGHDGNPRTFSRSGERASCPETSRGLKGAGPTGWKYARRQQPDISHQSSDLIIEQRPCA